MATTTSSLETDSLKEAALAEFPEELKDIQFEHLDDLIYRVTLVFQNNITGLASLFQMKAKAHSSIKSELT